MSSQFKSDVPRAGALSQAHQRAHFLRSCRKGDPVPYSKRGASDLRVLPCLKKALRVGSSFLSSLPWPPRNGWEWAEVSCSPGTQGRDKGKDGGVKEAVPETQRESARSGEEVAFEGGLKQRRDSDQEGFGRPLR